MLYAPNNRKTLKSCYGENEGSSNTIRCLAIDNRRLSEKDVEGAKNAVYSFMIGEHKN